ncbi:MAG: flavodoxin-dependent (E)-4-hydroxy-3-methylbut-2-enyl-diphosphate synthase [Desulfobacteraceae bacterium]|nr:flavodoxin-dependent (E)-4-hydroxy-3-methylbut-2-enyl-diphosphate synthase [Desulfobacteraceae bacterium]
MDRNKTRKIKLGNVYIGGGSPVSVQSMTNTKTEDYESTINQIKRLENAGCEIVRVAVPGEEAGMALKKICAGSDIPVVADIHFDYKLALLSLESGVSGLRINPGNIGAKWKVEEVVKAAKSRSVPIRIGVNAGSLEKELLKKYGGAVPEAMVESAESHIRILEDLDFHDIKVSLKASDVDRTIKAYSLFSMKSDIPLHLGITEAGGLYPGIVKSSIGLGLMLSNGIGDTLRVSLSRDPVEEVRVGFEILKALGLREKGVDIISCPTCGRCRFDLFKVLEDVEKELINIDQPIKVAIMGCAVNGPGEAREADIGIAGGDKEGILFKKGKVVKKIPQDKMVETLVSEIREMTGSSAEI